MMGIYYGHMGGLGLGFGLGWLFFIIFWGLIIWAIFALVRGAGYHHCRHCGERYGNGSSESGGANKGNNALNILKERYAKGELSKDDFDRMKKDLE